jgi:dephospho-CoA kinase
MYVVGVTGGIGSGKTAVSNLFADLGVAVVDADVAQRVVVEKGTPALAKIAEHFGSEILLEDGNLNRPALRKIVFSQDQERGWLERLLHPLIFRELQKKLNQADSDYALLVSPLLIETGQARLTQRILVVDAPEKLRIQRTTARDGNSEAQIRAIMAAQTDRETRLARADDVVVNDGELSALTAKVGDLHKQYCELAKIAQQND